MEKELKIICPFCNAPYTAEMLSDFDYSMGSEYTGMYGENVTTAIYCSNCKRKVYQKNTTDTSNQLPESLTNL